LFCSPVKSRCRGDVGGAFAVGAGVASLLPAPTALALPARSPTNWPAASLRSLQASSPGRHKPSVALNAGLEGLLHPPPSLGGIVSHPRKEREDGASSLVVLHGWASPRAGGGRLGRASAIGLWASAEKTSGCLRAARFVLLPCEVAVQGRCWRRLRCGCRRRFAPSCAHGSRAPRPLAHELAGCVASLLAGQFARRAQAECGFERRPGRPAPPSSLFRRHRVPPSQRTRGWGTLSRGAAWMGQPPASLSLFAGQFARGVFKT
jgi:hypothetical protein